MIRALAKLPLWLSELIPVVAGTAAGFFYFITVLPVAELFTKRYIIVIIAVTILTRIPRTWYYQKHLFPPLTNYLRAREQGASLSVPQLTEMYKDLASFVTKYQLCNMWLWVGAASTVIIADQIWMVGNWLSFFTLLFTTLIVMMIGLSLSYFIIKAKIAPTMEEIQPDLPQLPDVSRWRVSFRSKVILVVMSLVSLSMLASTLLLYSRMAQQIDNVALAEGGQRLGAIAEQFDQTPPAEWASAPALYEPTLWRIAAVDSKGVLLAGCMGSCHGSGADRTAGNVKGYLSSVGKWLALGKARSDKDEPIMTPMGSILVKPLGGDAKLLLMPHVGYLLDIRRQFISTSVVALAIALLCLGTIIVLLGTDLSNSLMKIEKISKQLAEGDLRSLSPVWSDDELGDLADNLKQTHAGLKKMTREVTNASKVVDEEVARMVSTTQVISRDIRSQNQFVDKTTISVKSNENSVKRISDAMEQVVNSTQEVSSTILEMQASVEEIAGNADVLTQSVEQTVTSSNEIASSAEAVNGSTDQLHQNSQEAVSFLTELDAALEETRRNARALSDTASHVTGDAEKGFNTVAAVEEEIIRMRKASEQSQRSLLSLTGAIERIGKIVDVIQDITEQTNLLSLNASIIAAGAGEYGKSFSVVATQIRELSARTAGNAKEIRDMIRSIKVGGEEISSSMSRVYEMVDKSFNLSRTAGDSLKTILESASNQEEMSKRIAIATDELAHGGQSASRTMQRIFSMIEGITKAAQEQAKSTRFLNEEAEKVREVALQLKNATDEQAKGARVISEAIARITEDSQQTSVTVQAQAGETKALSESMIQLSEISANIQQAFQELSKTSSRLQQSAQSLSQEIHSIKAS